MTMKKTFLGVGWHAVNPKTGQYFKRPFTSTTTADSDLISAVASEDKTWNQLLKEHYLSTDVVEVAEKFIADGYGDEKIKERVRIQ